ncbi:MAG: lipoate--protein ligase family protein, partial [Candidatus Helarchaeota archaeon]
SQNTYWRLILPEFTNPFFNLALEEVLFREVINKKSNFIIRFWKNTPSCIIGRHQYLAQEVNEEYCSKNKIPVIRRISGGGAVYLDLGCLNFSFIFRNKKKFDLTDLNKSYERILKPIIDALRRLSFNVNYFPPNSIYLNGKKLSGCAQYRRGQYILFHGTLLLNSNLNILKKCLTPKEEEKNVIAVRSRRVETINLLENNRNLKKEQKIIAFILKSLQGRFNITLKRDEIKMGEIKASRALITEKHLSANWYYGYFDENLEYKIE